jgi:hypothetical protein
LTQALFAFTFGANKTLDTGDLGVYYGNSINYIRSFEVSKRSPSAKLVKKLADAEDRAVKYEALLKVKRAREDALVDDVEEILFEDDYVFTAAARASIRRNFAGSLKPDQITDAAWIAVSRDFEDSEDTIKYLFGVCWGMKKADGRETRYA